MLKEHFDTTSPVRLELKVPVSVVTVVTNEMGTSDVTVEGPQRLLDATTIELIGSRLIVSIQRKLFMGWARHAGGALAVTVTVPHDSQVELMSASGDATLDGQFARLDVQTASGAVRVTGEVTGDAKVQTVSGDIRLPHIAGSLTAGSVSGDVRAEAVGGSVSAKSVSGDVYVGSVRDGKVNVQSVSGDVEVGIAAGTNLDVDAASASGTLSSEVPLSNTPSAGGGPTVVVRGKTVSGDVRVFRAA